MDTEVTVKKTDETKIQEVQEKLQDRKTAINHLQSIAGMKKNEKGNLIIHSVAANKLNGEKLTEKANSNQLFMIHEGDVWLDPKLNVSEGTWIKVIDPDGKEQTLRVRHFTLEHQKAIKLGVAFHLGRLIAQEPKEKKAEGEKSEQAPGYYRIPSSFRFLFPAQLIKDHKITSIDPKQLDTILDSKAAKARHAKEAAEIKQYAKEIYLKMDVLHKEYLKYLGAKEDDKAKEFKQEFYGMHAWQYLSKKEITPPTNGIKV